ncbi:MAG: tetratricopeptide repeat protein [Blastocatellia bacterium]
MTLKLDSPLSRILVILGTGIICVLLFRVAVGHFVVRVVADQRYGFDREAMLSAIQKQPDSSRVNHRLAESEMTLDPEQALRHAARAVELSPWDYRSRRLLALAQELNGRQTEAQNSILASVKLAPNHGELNWTLANIFLRSGKLAESVPHFRIAATRRGATPDDSFDLMWKASGGSLDLLESMAENNAEMQLSLVKFLVNQARIQDAITIFSAIDRGARLKSVQSGEFIRGLINARQFGPARQLWLDLACAQSNVNAASTGLVWNPGFETDLLKNFGQFDWVINANKYARIGFDRSQARSRMRSLRMLFSGIDTTTIKDQFYQMVVLRPGGRYRLECYVKSTDLVTPEGPRLAITGSGGSVIASSEPVAEGSSDWRAWAVDFTAPADNTPTFISIIRIPKFSYDNPTRGTVWFDDFSLTELGRK